MAAEIKEVRGVDATLIKGGGGEFEVTLDGQLIFSKKAEKRYPETEEILEKIPANASS